MTDTRSRRFDLIAFDWDGTLFDSTQIIVRCIQAAVGDVGGAVPSDEAAAYVIGMALFTIIMGNGFAAFPVMTGGVGVPVLVGVYHGDPAVMAAIGMLSGYCGTLLTPMAANFNIVPAALLELPDKNAVIRAQVPTALALLTANVFLLYFLMFR